MNKPSKRYGNQSKETEGALVSARFHLRGGKRYLQRGLPSAGMAALYEAVLCGMRYYITRHERCSAFVKNADLWDAALLFHALARAGVFEDPNAFNRLSLVVERALWEGYVSSDINATVVEVEKILKKLGVISCDENILLGGSRISYGS